MSDKPMISGGYILLSRKIIESQIFKKPPLYLKVWIYLLCSAQHGEYKSLKRGQLYISIPDIVDKCSYMVGYRKIKPSKKQIFDILEWLRNPYERNDEGNANGTMIVTTKVTHGMLVNIENYGVYQTPKFYESNDEGNGESFTKVLRTERQGNNINKNVKNVQEKRKKDFTPTADFEKPKPKNQKPKQLQPNEDLPDGVEQLPDGTLSYANVKRSWD